MADENTRQGTAYHNPSILEWATRVHAPQDEHLRRAFEAPERLGLPAIQVSLADGKLLGLLLRMVGAEKVVEVGTLAGYSALCMARALPPGGRVWSVEADPEHARVARENIIGAGMANCVGILEGEALKVLPSLEGLGPFDAVFVDADKENYPAYGAWAAKNLRPGGLLLADNAFYFGQLLGDDPTASQMRRFHEESRTAFDTVVIPTADGLLLGIRKG